MVTHKFMLTNIALFAYKSEIVVSEQLNLRNTDANAFCNSIL